MMARKKQKGLNEHHIRILEVIAHYQEQKGYSPSIRQICELAQISSTSVANYYLNHLRSEKYIERAEKVARGISLTQRALDFLRVSAGRVQDATEMVRRSMEETLNIPIVGRIVASEPVTTFANEHSENMIDVARSMLPVRDSALGDLFALEVSGDSMIDAMVHDGDVVIMRHAEEARNGEMVAIWLTDRDETTLKYFYREGNKVRLQPANPTMKPIYIEDPTTIRIQGKVLMVVRQLGSPLA